MPDHRDLLDLDTAFARAAYLAATESDGESEGEDENEDEADTQP